MTLFSVKEGYERQYKCPTTNENLSAFDIYFNNGICIRCGNVNKEFHTISHYIKDRVKVKRYRFLGLTYKKEEIKQ